MPKAVENRDRDWQIYDADEGDFAVDVDVEGEDDGDGGDDDDVDDEPFILSEIDPASCRHQVASAVFATTRVLAQKLKQHQSKNSTIFPPTNVY